MDTHNIHLLENQRIVILKTFLGFLKLFVPMSHLEPIANFTSSTNAMKFSFVYWNEKKLSSFRTISGYGYCEYKKNGTIQNWFIEWFPRNWEHWLPKIRIEKIVFYHSQIHNWYFKLLNILRINIYELRYICLDIFGFKKCNL